ncbi:MAG: hypothetical protein JWM87_2986 [Candidatus Eremiobacteraeota bacterium]|nr:hypothetical protein [Candidatus Eremiobacteraeota bacterium]
MNVRPGAASGNVRAGTPPANGRARIALFVAAICVLAAAFAALVRYQGVRSPLGIAALLAIELAAIAIAVGFHLVELPSAAPRDAGRAEPLRVDVDYL